MNSKQMTWEQIPTAIKIIASRHENRQMQSTYPRDQLTIANEIMEAMKPELKKAYHKVFYNGIPRFD